MSGTRIGDLRRVSELAFPALFYAVGIAAFSLWSFWSDRSAVLADIDKRLMQAAETIKYVLPPDFHDRAVEPDAIGNMEDTGNIMGLTQFAKSVDVTYLATTVPAASQAFFTANSAREQDTLDIRVRYYWEPVPAEHQAAVAYSVESGQPFYYSSHEPSGRFRNAVIPETSPSGNRFASIAGLDINHIDHLLIQQIPLSVLQGVFFLLLATPLMLAFNRAQTRHLSELHEAKVLAEKAQLEMLRYQLNPHFLFNTLNSVHTLIGENSTLAQEMIHSLADFCRASLYRRGEEFSRVDQELELVKNYLEIEKVRWGNELMFTIRCPSELAACRIPAFVFQPLVENAVKYGQLSDSSPLQLEIEVAAEGRTLLLSVANTGRWFSATDERPPGQSLGVGLENLKRRMERLIPQFVGMNTIAKEGWVRVTLCIPNEPWNQFAP